MRIALILAALAVLAAVPWFGSDVLIQFGINALLLAVLAQGWNIIGGYTGYASFGNSVFYGLGSYGVGIAMVQSATAVRGRSCARRGARVGLRRSPRGAGSAAEGALLRDRHTGAGSGDDRDRLQREAGRPEYRPRLAAAQQ